MKKKRITEHSVIPPKPWKNALLSLIFMLLMVFQTFAQSQVTGKVADSEGGPLPGVTVVVKGTTQGTITDANGNFVLTSLPQNAILVFSFVGMRMQEIPVANQSYFNVVMQEESIGIEEIVAVGYGSMRRKDLTGSVSSVAGNMIKDVPVTSAAQAITGRMAGVQITKTEGSPDAEIQIRVRGGGSVTQDNSPLLLVDGFPVSNINDIAPTDIESIDVLKDASSTAIYGAQGANGVILITTKSGMEGKGKISYNNYFGLKKISRMLDVMDPYEFVLWTYESFAYKTTPQSKYGDFRDYDLYNEIDGTDWQEEVFGRTGASMYHNLAFTGGSKTTKYNISLTHNDEKEIMLGSGYKRTNLSINFTQNINDWLTIELRPRYSNTSLKGAGTTGGLFRLHSIVQYRPVNGLMDLIDESLGDTDDYEPVATGNYNPVDMINDDYRRSRRIVSNLNGTAIIKLSKNLKYNLALGYENTENKNDNFWGMNTFNAYYTGRPVGRKSISSSESYRIANTLVYTKKDFLPGNNVSAMIGEEITHSKTNYVTNDVNIYPEFIDPESALAMMQLAEIPLVSTGVGTPIRISSLFGRLNYDYKARYNASFTLRADGSSKFAPENQWGYFPSFGLGWNISEEKFMSKPEWLTFLKLRISSGAAGNNRITDNAWQKTFTVNTNTLYMNDPLTKTTFFQASNILSNNNLKWETTISRNLGFDFVLFKDRISGNVDLYKNSVKDLLIRAILPSASGYSYQWQNIGETSNRGFEIKLDGLIIKQKDFNLSATFNIGVNLNNS